MKHDKRPMGWLGITPSVKWNGTVLLVTLMLLAYKNLRCAVVWLLWSDHYITSCSFHSIAILCQKESRRTSRRRKRESLGVSVHSVWDDDPAAQRALSTDGSSLWLAVCPEDGRRSGPVVAGSIWLWGHPALPLPFALSVPSTPPSTLWSFSFTRFGTRIKKPTPRAFLPQTLDTFVFTHWCKKKPDTYQSSISINVTVSHYLTLHVRYV